MSTSPQSAGQRSIRVHLEQEPEVTQEVCSCSLGLCSPHRETRFNGRFGLDESLSFKCSYNFYTGLCHRYIIDYFERGPSISTHLLTALGYLYSAVSLSLINAENARGVLAAGCLLGGMDDICAYAYETCKRSMNVHTISNWLKFLDPTPSSADATSPTEVPSTSVFGLYADRLRAEIFNYLVVTLPNVLDVHSTSPSDSPAQASSGRDTLLHIFSLIPFDMFKAAVESPTFQIGIVSLNLYDPPQVHRCLVSLGSDQARFKFAKDAIELRKQARGSSMAEETVVLAFGGGNFGGSAVHITKKMKRRPLWKVNA